MTKLSDLTTRKGLLAEFAKEGITTLEQSARKGTRTLLHVRQCGRGTVVALMKHCHARGIKWNKSQDEKDTLRELHKYLMTTYHFDKKTATQVCEVYFVEGWVTEKGPF